VITFALGTALVVLAPFLCGTVFGPGFAPAAEQTRVLVLGAFGIAALKLFGNALTGQGKPLRETASITRLPGLSWNFGDDPHGLMVTR
jgi:O-antigen/teichoic acid export membrane protein